MFIHGHRILLGLLLIVITISFGACSSNKKVVPEVSHEKLLVPALSPAERLIQFVDTGNPTLLNGIFTDSVLERMSVNEMVSTRKDFIRSFGKLLRAEGPFFDSDTSATVTLFHEDMTLAAMLLFDSSGLIKDLKIKQDLGDEQLGAF